MTTKGRTLIDLARRFHENLPEIRQYLNGRGIPDEMIDLNLLGRNGWRITIPISIVTGISFSSTKPKTQKTKPIALR
jgi:hypothetical protein